MEFGGKKVPKRFFIAFTAAALLAGNAIAWNHTELKWQTIETAHFAVHYHAGVEASAFEVARIAEEVYGPITTLYGYTPEQVHIHVTDRAGLPEGASYYYLNRIDINTDDIDFHLRGNADWLRNVITHEFTHMVSLQSSMKFPRWLPAVYLQGFNFEKEKRPDVITGYPNFTGSLPISGEAVPNWFAEGVAQYQAHGARNDFWDSHRDMVLRMAVLDDRLLTLDQMGVFGKTSANAELLYNQGFSLVLHIARKYGEEKIGQLAPAHGKIWRTGFGGACSEVLGISEDELYEEWKADITMRYNRQEAGVQPVRDGVKAAGRGFFNFYPLSDGKGGLFYVSNMGKPYRYLYLVHRDASGEEKVIASDLSSSISIAPDGNELVYSKKTGDNPHGYEFDDIYRYDLAAEREERVTESLKAACPAYSPDGSSVAFIVTGDGFCSIGLKPLSGGDVRMLTRDVEGRRYTGLSWSGKGLLSARFEGPSRDIVLIDPESGREKVVIGTGADERNPAWASDESGFFYSSDRTGIFNIYFRDLSTDSDIQVTRVAGGAFQPGPDGKGIYYSAFGMNGYEIRKIEGWRSMEALRPARLDSSLIAERSEVVGSALFDTRADTLQTAGPYKVTYTNPFIFPRAMVYDRKFRLGMVIDSRDFLDRQSVYAAASASFDGEFDLQLGAELRQFKPTFNFDILRMRKYWEIYESSLGNVRYRYDLWDAYFTCRLEFEQETPRKKKELGLRYNHGEYGVNINAWEAIGVELGWNYYKADEVALLFDYMTVRSGLESGINPRGGRKLHIEASAVKAKLSSGDFEYSFQPLYNDNDFMRYQVFYEEYIGLPFWAHSLTAFVRLGWIDHEEIDDFFYLYLGSRDGLRGYSYYSTGGTKNAMARLTYRFPLWRNIDRQIPALYFRSLYAAIFAEGGKAWNENKFDVADPLTSAGYELRMSGFTFFSYPLAVTFMGAYGFDEIEFTDPFVTDLTYTEGRSWRYYGSVLFSF